MFGLSACGPVVCNVPATAFASHDEVGTAPRVTVKCGKDVIASAFCKDGGGKRRTSKGWSILCDGDEIARVELPKDVTQ